MCNGHGGALRKLPQTGARPARLQGKNPAAGNSSDDSTPICEATTSPLSATDQLLISGSSQPSSVFAGRGSRLTLTLRGWAALMLVCALNSRL